MSYQKKATKQLALVLSEQGAFRKLKVEILSKLGKKNWEKVLHDAKMMVVLDRI